MTKHIVPIIEYTDPIRKTCQLFVVAMVNKKGVGQFLIDTGASFTAISDDAAARWGIVPDASREPVEVMTAGGRIQANTANVNLIIGDIELSNMEVLVCDFNGKDIMMAGLLGADFFRRFQTIAFNKTSMELETHV